MSSDLVHTLFEAQAALRPGAVALVHGDERLTYAELNARANRLAHRLRGLGVGPEVPVAVFLPRTPELVVALLGVLKAGGAYVPLDPAYPPARTAFVLEDTGTRVVLTRSSLADRLPRGAARRLPLDREAGALEGLPDTDPAPLAGPESLAYVIHTSGSTGGPKGVAVEHRSAVALLRWLRGEVTDDERESVLFSSSVCFDASFAELFGALCWGGKGVLVEDVLALAGLREEVRLVHVVPSAAAELARGGGFPPGVRAIALGGEAVPPVLAREIHERTSVRRVLNLYGPTEDTVVSTCALLSPAQEPPIPIGPPVAGKGVRVLDRSLSPVPPGAEGEMFTAGAGVARGYLGRPGLTAERFLPDPFSPEPGARMYRTGDLGRLRPDGALEYLGRADRQAKVRGHRIEPGEVEAALLEHPGVAEAAVVARGEEGGGTYLAAYVAGAHNEPPPREELRAWLIDRLPAYMVPTAWAALPALPRTPSGKVDRLALPAADPAPAGSVPPRTPVEELIAGIWSEVLGVPAVGARDDFYALGGHSLRAAQVAARVREVLRVGLSLPAVLWLPTVEAQAAEVGRLLAGGAAPGERIPRVPRDGPLPLSSAQEAVWFLERLAPGMRSYQFQAAVRFRGSLDPVALHRSLCEIVRRHEIFLTTFPEVDGAPVQRVHPPGPVRIPLVDLHRVPAERREAELERAFGAEFDRPFRTDALPMVRWTLYRLAADENVLLCVEHHLVHDGWSFGVFLRDLVALYTASARGEPSPLPEPAVQFADYAAWQRARMGSAETEADLEFWRGRLRGAPTDLEIPADHPRPARISFRGHSLHLRLPPGLARAADGFGRARGVTLYMTLLAAFQALLHRYTGREDFLVGGGSAGRRLRELEDVIGMVVNVVPLRADLAGDPSFLALVERVRASALETYAHQDLPFAAIVEAVQPERSLDRLPLVQVAFNVHHAPYPELRLPGLELEVREGLGNRSAKFDLQVIAIPRGQQGASAGDEVVLLWEYSTDLFERSTVERMARHYETLLDGALSAPERPLSRVPLLGDAERRELEGWGAAPALPPDRGTVHGRFAAAARHDPHAVAVEYGGRTLTYGELDRAAARVAGRLRALGVAREARVGVWAERSPEMVAAMLGTLRAGAACLPLDPELPEERLSWMLADAGAAALLVPGAVDAAPASFGGPTLALADLPSWDPGGEESFGDADSVAFVYYTSGSTGRPRGIAVPHRGIARLALDTELAPLGPGDRVAQLSNASFDAASWELWGALLGGARVVGIAREDALAPHVLASRLRERGVTALFLTTALFNQVARAAPDALRGVRHVLFGGEEADPAAVRRVLQAGPPERLLHVYGPTEGTTFSTRHRVDAVPADATRVPIGRPVLGTRLRVLDGSLEPVPAGVPGELYLGGDGLARGYLGDPGGTAARFLPDPHSAERGSRLYRTGDLARWLPSGVLEFLGRADRQVKVRGFRVEPAEVEAALRSCPGVEDAVVAPRTDPSGERSLDAWVVPSSGESPDPSALREHLAARLPAYMVPDAFTSIDAVPLTSSGKTDRAALPAPDRAALRDAYRPPRTPEEEAVAAAWREELGVERVGADDDFFRLGGHSLRAVRVLGRIAETLGVQLPVSAVFEGPTVRAMAARVAAARAADEEELLRQLEWLEGLSDEEALARLRPGP